MTTRRPNDTEAALDDVVGSAAGEVQRTLDAEGVPRAIVTPRDVLRSRYPLDSVDDEAVTEEMYEGDPFTHRVGASKRPSGGASSLSPLAVGPRPSQVPPPAAPRLGPHARRAAWSSPDARGSMRTLYTRAPSGPWILLMGMLGGVAAFATVMAIRSSGTALPEPSRRPAAAADSIPFADAGAATSTADAAPAAPAPPAASARDKRSKVPLRR